MPTIIAEWLHQRLGILLDTSTEDFAVKTADGHLLANIFASYGLITSEQLELIQETLVVRQCYENFKFIKVWLNNLLDIILEDDNLYEIVHGIGTASLNLFYLVYLVLQDKSKLDGILDVQVKQQLADEKPATRFNLERVPTKICLDEFYKNKIKLCVPGLDDGDVYIWYKKRMEQLQAFCKESREEYLHKVRNQYRTCDIDNIPNVRDSSFIVPGSSEQYEPQVSPPYDRQGFGDGDVSIDERTYQELLDLEQAVKALKPIVPDPIQADKCVKNIKVKSKKKKESKILSKQVMAEIMNNFEKEMEQSNSVLGDEAMARMLLNQSNYEKMMVMKMVQVKMQKEFMLENKRIQCEQLNKLKEKQFIETLISKDKELKEKKLTYYFERERIAELHRRIWNERLRIKVKKDLEMCSKTVRDLVDMSVKIAEYQKKYKQELSRHKMEQLKNAFLSNQSTFDYVKPVSRIIKEDSNEDIPEKILQKETDRQNAIDEEELFKYINYITPWQLKNIEVTPEILDQISRSLNILGHIVHQLLVAKYPLPPVPKLPDFPLVTIKVCIIDLTDLSSLPMLRQLLSQREIEVIEMRQAIGYCVEAFWKESECEYKYEIESVAEKNIKNKKETKPEKTLKKGAKSNSKASKSQKEEQPEPMKEEKVNKTVQTPIVYPCEEIPYSRQAELGKTAQEILSSGQPLTDFLLVAMFIEYLKSLPNLKGWALVNYPSTFQQALILEEAFTGVHMLDKCNAQPVVISDIAEIEENETDIFSMDDCALNEKRKSQLLPNPFQPPEESKMQNSCLTAFIRLKKLPTTTEASGDISLPPVYEQLGNESERLDRFYSEAGLNYSMYYESFDVATIKYLGKLIIGDYSLPLKSSIELFGDIDIEVRNETGMMAKSAKKGGKIKPKAKEKKASPTAEKELTINGGESIKSKKENKQKGKKKDAKVVIVHEDKGVQVPEPVEEEIEEIPSASEIVEETPKAGQPRWEYCVICFKEELMIALAILWEAVEESYINDLKQLFFLKRINMNAIMPFTHHAKETVKEIIDQPDYNAYYLAKFQKAFNAFDCDFRRDDEFKAEMFCRIHDFKERLFENCDEKAILAEKERCRLIQSNWCAREICEMTNNFINMMEIELERTIQSIRLIDAYYLGVFTDNFPENDIVKEEHFPKITRLDDDIANNVFQYRDSSLNLTYFETSFVSFIQKANATIKKHLVISINNLASIESQTETANGKTKSKPVTDKSKRSKVSANVTICSSLPKEIQTALLEEWRCAITGESVRGDMRFNLLKLNALQTIEEMFKIMIRCFHEIFDDVQSKYRNLLESVRQACDIFHWAVEKERPVQNELIFHDGKFYINPEVKLFHDPWIIQPLSLEVVAEGVFTIEQLSNLLKVLQDLGPTGYIPMMNFNFILQDFIWNDSVSGINPSAPPLWKRLDSLRLKTVVNELFDEIEYVYWRDFFIYNFRIPFPSETEILVMRKKFKTYDPDSTELIRCHQFSNTRLWFESMSHDTLRIEGVKKLLKKMYSIQDGRVNYTALLLDFCKDQQPIVGFAKALELALGKMVCWDKETGEAFKAQHIKNVKEHEESVRQRDEERQLYLEQVNEELNQLVDRVVYMCDGVIIEDYIEDTEDKNEECIQEGDISEVEQQSTVDLAKEISTANGTNSSSGSLIPKILQKLLDRVANEPSLYTQMQLHLSIDVLIDVITAALPWHSRIQYFGDSTFVEHAEQIHKKCKNQWFNGAVLIHDYLNSEDFLKLLMTTKKFCSLDPIKVVRKVLHEE